MRRLVHLSDLHFGRDRPELAEPLIAAVTAGGGGGAEVIVHFGVGPRLSAEHGGPRRDRQHCLPLGAGR